VFKKILKEAAQALIAMLVMGVVVIGTMWGMWEVIKSNSNIEGGGGYLLLLFLFISFLFYVSFQNR